MALSIKIVTTNGITRQFYQSDSDLIHAFIHRLKHSSNIFTSSNLIISSELQTEIFTPKYIATIELDWDHSQALKMPSTGMVFTTIGGSDASFAYDLDVEPELNAEADSNRSKVQFYFFGGHSITTELAITNDALSQAEQTRRITKTFEQPVFFYQTQNEGLGLFNPRVMTRIVITPCALHLPPETILVDDY